MNKLILNTEFCKIEETDKELNVFIAMKDGGWLEHTPYPNDMKGLVAALDLAINCVSGKFFPRRERKEVKETNKPIEFKPVIPFLKV